MAGLGDLFQKAVYLGVGLASYTGEKASERLTELRGQAQKLVDELVQRGEITAEEGRRMVDDMVQRSQGQRSGDRPAEPAAPRTIDIEVDEVATAPSQVGAAAPTPPTAAAQDDATRRQADALRSEVERLQAELERLKGNG